MKKIMFALALLSNNLYGEYCNDCVETKIIPATIYLIGGQTLIHFEGHWYEISMEHMKQCPCVPIEFYSNPP